MGRIKLNIACTIMQNMIKKLCMQNMQKNYVYMFHSHVQGFITECDRNKKTVKQGKLAKYEIQTIVRKISLTGC